MPRANNVCVLVGRWSALLGWGVGVFDEKTPSNKAWHPTKVPCVLYMDEWTKLVMGYFFVVRTC